MGEMADDEIPATVDGDLSGANGGVSSAEAGPPHPTPLPAGERETGADVGGFGPSAEAEPLHPNQSSGRPVPRTGQGAAELPAGERELGGEGERDDEAEAAPEYVVPYEARAVFNPLHFRKARWAVAVAHRRAGKTVACIAELITRAATFPRADGRFAYIAPRLNQAKDIAWHYLLHYSEGFAPGRRTSASELWIELPNNKAQIRLYGAENPDRLRGLRLDGVVLDEFGDMEPRTWSQVIRPALSDREGWAIFIGTPKGRNGFHRIWQAAERDPDWLQLTLKASATRLIGYKELGDVRKTLSDEEYAQEYECSFDAAVRGAYWGREMAAAEQAKRIGSVPHDPALPVHTAWDLGMADSTVIWFLQQHGVSGETRVIDVIKGEGAGLEWYAQALQARPQLHGRTDWVWGDHYLPHDARVRELGTGQSRIERLAELGIRATVSPFLPVEDGIQAVRTMLANSWFDRERCANGIEALKMYRRGWDDRRQEYGVAPLHDWTSHYADALRCFAVGRRPAAVSKWMTMKLPKRDTRWVV